MRLLRQEQNWRATLNLSQAKVKLYLLRAVSELGRATIQASPCYLRNHQRVFDYPLNTLSYPISQGSEVGFVRSPLDRQKIVDYIDKEIRESLKYGQGPLIYQTREEQKNKVK
jgi:hypothetical protein